MTAPHPDAYRRLTQRGRELATEALRIEMEHYQRVIRAGGVRKLKHATAAKRETAALIAIAKPMVPLIVDRFGDTPELQRARRAQIGA